MSKIKFYFDEMIHGVVAKELNNQGYEVVMAVHMDMMEQDDEKHLKVATEQNAVLVTLDQPFAGRTMSLDDHAGLICWTGKGNDIGALIRRLSDFADTYTAEEVVGKAFWLKV
jgi:predicted nuclease of predicted toxin-antitoxin system